MQLVRGREGHVCCICFAFALHLHECVLERQGMREHCIWLRGLSEEGVAPEPKGSKGARNQDPATSTFAAASLQVAKAFGVLFHSIQNESDVMSAHNK